MFVLTKNKFIKGIKEIKINFQEKIKEKIKPTKKDILKINNNVEFKNSLVEFMCFFLVGAIVFSVYALLNVKNKKKFQKKPHLKDAALYTNKKTAKIKQNDFLFPF